MIEVRQILLRERTIWRGQSITEDNVDECLHLVTSTGGRRMPESDRAICEAFAHYDRLGAFGSAIRVDGAIEAFTVAGRLDPGTAVIHFEEVNPRFDGLREVNFRWFCENSLRPYEWVNGKQDFGSASVRRAKLSYRPHHFVRKFTVRPSS